MGFLDQVKSRLKLTVIDGWKELSDIRQFKNIKDSSAVKPVILFKHSTTCGISANAKFRLEDHWSELSTDVDFYYLDLLNYRPVSNYIATEFGVVHQSPQIIILSHGKAIYNTSHHNISIAAINSALDQITKS